MSDFSSCDTEPIHLAGSIQPAGVLLILDADNYQVIQASANTETLLGKSALQLVEYKLEQLFDISVVETVRTWHRQTRTLFLPPLRLSLPIDGATRQVDMVVHRSERLLQVELLPVIEQNSAPVNLFHNVLTLSENISHASDVAQLLSVAANEVAAVIGAQRVMVYEFDEEFHGTVTFEILAPGCTESYMGLKFPASDIPPQARALYVKNNIRVIVDTQARSIPLQPPTNRLTRQTDLTYASLRSVSPAHLEYLANMGVRSSMSISLVINEALWGMIICHHDTPLQIAPDNRNYCEILGQLVSLQAAQLLQIAATEKNLHDQQALFGIFPTEVTTLRFSDLLLQREQSLRTLFEADCLVLHSNGRLVQSGHAVDEIALQNLVTLASAQAEDGLFETAALADALLAAGLPPVDGIGGLLYLEITADKKNFILLLRCELISQVNWAGNPTKTVIDGGSLIAPRKSFAQWQQTVRGQCLKWSAHTLRNARQLAILARDRVQVEAIKATQDQLVQAEKMGSIGQLAAGVAHEINNPIGFVSSNLSTLQSYWDEVITLLDGYDLALQSDAGNSALTTKINDLRQAADIEFLKEDAPVLISQSRDGIVRVKDIVQNLKDFSHVGNEDKWTNADLCRAMDSTLTIVYAELKYKAELRKEYSTLPEVWCVPSQLNQVFMNLLINAGQAIATRGVITIRMRATDDQVIIEVSDTGAGIAPEHLSKIFDPFFTTKEIGQGTGLGLSISYGIIEKHKGQITVDSVVGQGTTFRIALPILAT